MLDAASRSGAASHGRIVTECKVGRQSTTMTSLIAWIGVDSHGPASAYFASDSRLTWPGSAVWDHGRKLFACRRYPHILGYCGDVLFPIQTLSQITEMIDSDLLLGPSDQGDTCTQRIAAVISSALETYPPGAKQSFDGSTVCARRRSPVAIPSQANSLRRDIIATDNGYRLTPPVSSSSNRREWNTCVQSTSRTVAGERRRWNQPGCVLGLLRFPAFW